MRIAKRDAAYYRKHRAAVLKRAADYYRRNRSKKLRYSKEYSRRNRTKILRYGVKYRMLHREEIATQVRKYYRTAFGKYKQMLRRHFERLVLRGIAGKPMSFYQYRAKLYHSDGSEKCCWYCGGENNKTGSGLDRLNNKTSYTKKNTVPCCRGCNVWRGFSHSVPETRGHFKPMRDAVRKNKRKTNETS